MKGSLFALVNAENRDEVVAWGMEITFEDRGTGIEGRVAVVYRHEPGDLRDTHSQHGSAEDARNAYGRALPIDLDLIWRAGFPQAATGTPVGCDCATWLDESSSP